MKTINNFFLDKNKKGHQNCKFLKDFIEKLTEEKEMSMILNDFSKIIDIPLNILKDKSKQLILNKFNFKIGKFNLNFKTSKVFQDYFIFLYLIFLQLFNKIQKKPLSNIATVESLNDKKYFELFVISDNG